MSNPTTFLEALRERGVSRRTFLKFCAITASSLGLSSREAQLFAQTLAATPRPTVIWLSFQQCTGCSESILRSFDPSVENLILNVISLDYQETLQVAAGDQAEAARRAAMQAAFGKYVLIVDGAIPSGETEMWSAVAGNSNLATLQEAVNGAALVVALGTCASFGGLPAAYPNPSGAAGFEDLVTRGLITADLNKVVNISGCPPVPEVITGTIAYFLVKGPPELDAFRRPKLYYGKTVHDCCPRLSHFNNGEFAQSFGDDFAKQGFCLFLLGCKGPETFNACTTVKWNQGTSSPTQSGHGCMGCSQPNFWDKGIVLDPVTGKATEFGGFYSTFSGVEPVNPDCTVPAPLLKG